MFSSFLRLALVLSLALLTSNARAQEAAPAPPALPSLHLQPLPIGRWLEEQAVTVVTSPHDIGEINDVFDGDASTLMRSQQVNPQQTTIQFDGTVSLAGTRVMISHHVGRWKVEAMVWAKDAKSPTKTEVVPWTNAGEREFNEIILPRNLAVSEITLTVERIGGDDYVHLNEWELLTEITGQ